MSHTRKKFKLIIKKSLKPKKDKKREYHEKFVGDLSRVIAISQGSSQALNMRFLPSGIRNTIIECHIGSICQDQCTFNTKSLPESSFLRVIRILSANKKQDVKHSISTEYCWDDLTFCVEKDCQYYTYRKTYLTSENYRGLDKNLKSTDDIDLNISTIVYDQVQCVPAMKYHSIRKRECSLFTIDGTICINLYKMTNLETSEKPQRGNAITNPFLISSYQQTPSVEYKTKENY